MTWFVERMPPWSIGARPETFLACPVGHPWVNSYDSHHLGQLTWLNSFRLTAMLLNIRRRV